MTIFNKEKVDFTKQPMFFGEEQNIQRYDQFKFSIFNKLTETQRGYFWQPKEISLQKDRSDFMLMRPEQKFIFTSNLKYQTLLDSIQGRGPGLAFAPYTSLPEIEGCIIWWQAFEQLHSESYTHIIKNVYPNPTTIFDTVLDTPEIVARAKTVTKYYDDFIEYADRWKMKDMLLPEFKKDLSLETLKQKLYLALVNVNILEGIRFYVSFACTFAFAELKLMEGSAKILSLIARDESQHLAITQNLIKNFKIEEPEVVASCTDLLYEMYNVAIEEEKEWAKYLFRDGSIIGLNETLLCQYVEFMANNRMKNIGLKQQFSQKENPLPWMSNWLASKGQQIAPQESENISYVIGGTKQDVSLDTFKGFKL